MKATKLFLMTAAMIGLSGVAPDSAVAQTATQIQQQKTEAASADQAARTNAAAQGQARKTEAASAAQAQKTNAASLQQTQETQAAAQKQANETAIRASQQSGGTVIIGVDAAGNAVVPNSNTPVRIYNEQATTAGQITPNNTIGGANIVTTPAEKQLQDLFNTIDKDHSGMVSKTEFSIYYSSTPEDPRFDSYDTNRDMMLSYFEFRAPNVSGVTVGLPRH